MQPLNALLGILKKHRSTIIIFGFFLILPFIFFYDTSTMQGILGEKDGLCYHFPHRLFSITLWQSGNIPLWNPYLSCGFPQLAALQTAVLYPPNILLFSLLPPIVAFNLIVLLHFSLAGFFTYLYMRALKSSTTPALFSGVAYMFCGILTNWANNTNVQNSFIWLPLILFFLEKIKQERQFIYVILASLSFAMLIFAGYPQTFIYMGMVILFYIVYITILATRNRFTVFSYGILILVLGSLLGAIQLIPTMELIDLSIRTKLTPDMPLISFASFKLRHLITFLFPYLFGSPNPGFYPVSYSVINLFFKGSGYMGIVPLMLTLTALLRRKDGDHIVLFWTFVSILSFLLAMGSNNPLFPLICRIPLYNLFYNTSMNMFNLDFSIAILSGVGLEYLISDNRREIRKKVAAFFIVVLLLITVMEGVIAAKAISGEMGNHYREKLAEILFITNPALYIPIIFMIISVSIYWFISIRPKKRIGHVILIAILFSDLFFFGHFLHQHSVKVEEFIHKDTYPPVATFLEKTEANPNSYRVFPVISHLAQIRSYDFIFSSTNILYPIGIIGTYDPLYLNNHFKLLKAKKNGAFQKPFDLARSNKTLSLLNVKYLIVNPQHAARIESMGAKTPIYNATLPPFWGQLKTGENEREVIPLYEKVFTSPSGTSIFKNRNVLPRTYLVTHLRPVKNFDAAYRILWDEKDQFNPSQEALVELDGDALPVSLAPGKASLTSYSTREVVIKAESTGQSFLVLSDTYYPGWKALIDGKETKIYKTNGIVRGIFLSSGSHVVKFVYSPLSFKVGTLISGVTLVMLLLTSLFIAVL